MSDKTYPIVCRTVREVMDIDDSVVLSRNTVLSDLEIEDFELADIRTQLETEFEITIPDEKIEDCNTVGRIDAVVRAIYLGEEEEEDPPED